LAAIHALKSHQQPTRIFWSPSISQVIDGHKLKSAATGTIQTFFSWLYQGLMKYH